jgi:hypothetical protein
VARIPSAPDTPCILKAPVRHMNQERLNRAGLAENGLWVTEVPQQRIVDGRQDQIAVSSGPLSRQAGSDRRNQDL